MKYENHLHFKSTIRNTSPYCPRCNVSFNVDTIQAEVNVNLSESTEPHQIRTSLFRAVPTMITENSDAIFMGALCPKCGKPMVLIDTGIVPFVKRLNAMKLFTSFSCEGHEEPDQTHPMTGLKYAGCESPYISFIDNGKTIQDILTWYVVSNRLKCVEGRNSDEYIVQDPSHPQFEGLMFDIRICALYAAKLYNPEDFKSARDAFLDGLYTLMHILPDMIRDWYDNCKDDSKYFVDTEAKKSRYLAAWEQNLNPVKAIEEYNGTETCQCC